MKTLFNKPTKLIYFYFLLLLNASMWGKEYPKRIISLGAAATEILFEIGAENQIAAVSSDSNFPLMAQKLPKAAGFGDSSISLEKLLSFEPDFVILYAGMHDFLIPMLNRYKIQFYVSNVNSVYNIIEEINKIAEITGHSLKGKELTFEYAEKLDSLKKANATLQRKRIYWEVWNNPYMSAGKGSFINDVIEISGGTNIFNQINQAYPIVSEERIISENPDFILIANDSGSTPETVKNRNGWSQINAVQNDCIIVIDSDIFNRPGPRIFSAIQELSGIIHE